jgi:hypothetical protein
MPVAENSQTPVQSANGISETVQLQAQITKLEAECRRLKQALAAAELERDRYRCAFLDQARAAREFEDLDVPTLERMSAGPVEKL